MAVLELRPTGKACKGCQLLESPICTRLVCSSGQEDWSYGGFGSNWLAMWHVLKAKFARGSLLAPCLTCYEIVLAVKLAPCELCSLAGKPVTKSRYPNNQSCKIRALTYGALVWRTAVHTWFFVFPGSGMIALQARKLVETGDAFLLEHNERAGRDKARTASTQVVQKN